jgi:hypothetical protein
MTDILLILLAIIIMIGIVRICLTPYTGIYNLMIEILFIDYLFDILEGIVNSFDDDDYTGMNST